MEARLNELETELTTAERHQQLVDTRRETERKLDHQRQALAETEQDLADRAASLGFEPRKMDAGLTAWLETLRAYHEQREHVATTQARLQHLTDDIADRRSRVIAFLTDYGEAPAGDEPASTTLAAALDRLDTRLSQRDNALKALSSADKEIAQAGNERERLTAQRTQFFERRGLADDDEAGLRRRLDRLEDWRTLNSQREQATGRVNLSRQRLLGEDDNPPPFALTLLELADNDDQQGLARHREHAEQASREADRCRNEIAQIRADIRQARNDRRLEAAEAKVQQARDRLDACYTQGLLERAGAFLVDEVEQEVQAIQRPVALAQAQSWFGAFTDDAYELQLLPGDAPAFVARDATTGRDYALSELSSGTRMQLLLAARLGFAVYAEGDRGQLPLFLDHALATTDPERFGAIAKTVQQIAAEQGRQVFYLTADPAEVSRWRHTLGSEAIREIDVAAIRGQADAIADVAALDTAPSPIAPPDEIGEDAFFRQLAIPYVDPWQDSGTIHIAYLLRDNPGLVHRLVAMGMGRAGQLRHFLHRQADTGILDADERQLIRARLAGAAAWVEAWTRGRGLPVDRDSLGSEDSPVNPDRTSKYEAIVAVADAHGHDPQALINALRGREVSNLQKKLIDKLEDYLSEGGYLPTGTPLAPEERRQRVAETLSQYMDAVKAGTVAETLTARLDAGVGHAASEADTAPE